MREDFIHQGYKGYACFDDTGHCYQFVIMIEVWRDRYDEIVPLPWADGDERYKHQDLVGRVRDSYLIDRWLREAGKGFHLSG